MKPSLLIAEQTAELGGSQFGVLDLLPDLTQEFSVLLAAPAEGPFTEQLSHRGVPWTLWPLGTYGSGGKSAGDIWRFARRFPSCAARLAELIQETGARLLVANGPRAFPAAAMAARRAGIPSVWNLHLELTNKRDRHLCQTAAALAHPRILACSHACLEVYSPRSWARRNGLVLYPGVAEPHVGQRQPTAIGVIGRLHPEKGQDLLLEAARSAPERIRFFFGEEDPQYRAKLERQARRLPAGTVEFRGWSDDIGAALAGLRVLVVPSRREALARVIMEAFAAGVPVIAARTGGIPEVVHHEQNGLLFPSGDAAALAASLRQLRDDPSLKRRLASQAQRDYHDHFHVARYRREMLAHLRTALGTSA